MLVVSKEDYLEVRKNSLIADYDRDIMATLYQPVIGYEAFGLYLTLWAEAEHEHSNTMITHETLFDRMKMTAGTFVDARKSLESIGLLRSYVTSVGDTNFYRYELLAPKTPEQFFGDVLLHGLLIKSIGENETSRIQRIYNLTPYDEKGKEITSSFKEVYRPDLSDPAFNRALEGGQNTLGRNSGAIDGGFSYETFFAELGKISQIRPDSIASAEMKEIERLAVLYGIGEEKAAAAVVSSFNTNTIKGKHVEFEGLTKQFQEETNYLYMAKRSTGYRRSGMVSGKSDLASKINMMETVSPKDYLSLLQGGTKAAPSDLMIINVLSRDYQLPNSVINAIIDFVLAKNNNVLSRAYVEKIAASVKRENIETTVDAMNYLKKTTKPGKYHHTVRASAASESVMDKEKTSKDGPEEPASAKENVEDELDWDKLMADLDKAGKGN